MEDICKLLFSVKKLERDQGVSHLKQFLNESTSVSETTHSVEKMLIKNLDDSESAWESKHGALLGANALVLHLKNSTLDDETELFLQAIYKHCLEFLTDLEVRIRLASGECVFHL